MPSRPATIATVLVLPRRGQHEWSHGGQPRVTFAREEARRRSSGARRSIGVVIAAVFTAGAAGVQPGPLDLVIGRPLVQSGHEARRSIGAGVRSPLFAAAALRRAARIGLDELFLMDIDGERLELFSALVRNEIRQTGSPVRLRRSTDATAALEGADHVVTTIRVGARRPGPG